MPSFKRILAIDLGAESGRGLIGRFDGNRLELELVHRFANGPVRTIDSMHWDVLHLYQEILNTMRLCAAKHGGVDSVGVDTWGVDFALLGRGDTLLGNSRHYRDPHTEGILEEAFARVPRLDLFRRTGIQFMRFNTLFQLLALQKAQSPLLEVAESFLMMPDLFHFFFTGNKVNEYTNATTTQMINPVTRKWAVDLVEEFGLPSGILGEIVPPGTMLGSLRPAVAAEAGLSSVPVIAPATHDTGSAVVATPASVNSSWAFISSGTWSLMGTEIPESLINEQVLHFNFTNEGGIDGTIRFLKNVMGLWLVQECRRDWKRAGQDLSYDELTRLAARARPFISLVNPDDESFLLPPSMPEALVHYCQKTNQPAPTDPGSFIRCVLESLALKYRWVIQRLEELLGKQLQAIHVMGGGSQNALLCQFTADACNRPVYAGPVEATAIGNLMAQAIGLGLVRSLNEAREVVRNSFDVVMYEPKNSENWHEPYERFCRFA